MRWHRTTRKPLTTESQIHVQTDDGREGWIRIRHRNGRPRPVGGVYSEPNEQYWDDGTPVEGKCLDLYPTID